MEKIVPAVASKERGLSLRSSVPSVSSGSNSSQTLIDDLLTEQRELTAVEIFSRAHDSCEVRGRRYENLLPAVAPAPGQQYAFEVDLDKCSGCKACVTACHSLNGLDEDETWRRVGALVSTNVRAPVTQIVTTACHHCVDPGCLNGCPVLAYDKDSVTGIVKHLDDQCIGCQYCVMKCPYEVPQYLPKRGIVRKCDMCSSRLAVGEAPACVQACPNEAIKITLVEQNRIRGKYRDPHVPTDAGMAGKRNREIFSANLFLPDSPNPAITLPTTRYITNRTLPVGLQAADAHDVQPAKAHPPLTFLLVLSQLGVGLVVRDALAGGLSRVNAIAALGVTFIAIIAGTLHLGQPLKAWRSFLGWRKSWFSRELIGFGAFLTALGVHIMILNPVSASIAALLGVGAVICSGMIYVDTRRPFWNVPMTFGKFFGTTLLLGAMASFPASFLAGNSPAGTPGFPGVALTACAIGAFIKLVAENRVHRFLVDEQSPHLNALSKTALLLAVHFGLLSRVRIACLMSGGAVLLLLTLMDSISANTLSALAAMAFALCLAGELIERHLFFVAEASPKMPGGGTT